MFVFVFSFGQISFSLLCFNLFFIFPSPLSFFTLSLPSPFVSQFSLCHFSSTFCSLSPPPPALFSLAIALFSLLSFMFDVFILSVFYSHPSPRSPRPRFRPSRSSPRSPPSPPSSVGSWVINNKFLMGFDDEQKLLMKSKTFELKINTLESLELRNKAVETTRVR